MALNDAIACLEKDTSYQRLEKNISMTKFLDNFSKYPKHYARNIFLSFTDMIKTKVGDGKDEYPGEESIGFMKYDFSELFTKHTDRPFKVDRVFGNRLIKLLDQMSMSNIKQIYSFEGPAGSGKSTFIDILLDKFMRWARTDEGVIYHTTWRLNYSDFDIDKDVFKNDMSYFANKDYVDIECPSNDHPLWIIPREIREEFVYNLLGKEKFEMLKKDRHYTDLFSVKACHMCQDIYDNISERFSVDKTLESIIVNPNEYKRIKSKGISVFNPGDKLRNNAMQDKTIQSILNNFFGYNNVLYVSSHMSKVKNGIYLLMDLKNGNVERYLNLHNIISDGIHKIDGFNIEEPLHSLILAVLNPEDMPKNTESLSLSDRNLRTTIPYILDYTAEMELHTDMFGKGVSDVFFPLVHEYLAKAIVATRLEKTKGIFEWIPKKNKYKFLDSDLQLLKMDIYTGLIPEYLSDEDRSRFVKRIRKKIVIKDTKNEGKKGISGRDSIKLFNAFMNEYGRDRNGDRSKHQKISFKNLMQFIVSKHEEFSDANTEIFRKMQQKYDHDIRTQIKDAMFAENKEQTRKDIFHYLVCLNNDIGTTQECTWTGEVVKVSDEFMRSIEDKLVGKSLSDKQRMQFRIKYQKRYVVEALEDGINGSAEHLSSSSVFKDLELLYRQKAMRKNLVKLFKNKQEYLSAIDDFGTDKFNAYDNRIKDDVSRLLQNLQTSKYGYDAVSAKIIATYAISELIRLKKRKK